MSFNADPNDPEYKRFRRQLAASMMLAQGVVAMTPTDKDDEIFAIVAEFVNGHAEEIWDILKAKQAAKK